MKIYFRNLKPVTVRSSLFLFLGMITIASSVYSLAPNPGHTWIEVGEGFTRFTGPTSLKTFTLPDVTSDILTDYNLVQGDLIYADAASSTAKLAKDTNATRYLANTGTSNNPKWDLVNLANGVSNSLSSGNGGTGNVNVTFTGPTTARTYTLPDANASIFTDNADVTVAQGGTGVGTLTANNLLTGNGTGNITSLSPAGTSSNVLMSSGTGWISATSADPVFFWPVGVSASTTTAVAAAVNATAYFEYIGVAPRAYTACSILQNVTTAAVTITWAEVGIFRGTPNINATTTLTKIGTASVSATYNSTGIKNTAVNSITINPGDNLWVAYGSSATTPFAVRGLAADSLSTGVFQTIASQPSTLSVSNTTLGLQNAIPAWTVVSCR